MDKSQRRTHVYGKRIGGSRLVAVEKRDGTRNAGKRTIFVAERVVRVISTSRTPDAGIDTHVDHC